MLILFLGILLVPAKEENNKNVYREILEKDKSYG
jgi:hypothetical protein